MLMIKNNFISIYRFQRLLSIYNKSNEKSTISSSIKLNSTVKELIDAKQYNQALDLFDQNFEICTDYTIDMAIKACTVSNDYKRGINIQQKLSSSSLNSCYIQTSLIRFYMQSHDIDNATRIFSTITNKSSYVYTAMFKGLMSNKMSEKVLDLLDEMTIKSDNFILAVSFNACAEVANDRAMKIGRKLFHEMPYNYQDDVVLLTSAIHMLMKFGDVQCAERIFDSINRKDTITYNAMIKGYVGNEMYEKALDLFEQMHLNLDNITYTIVFNACAHLANDQAIKIGRKLFHKMPNNYRNDNILLNSAIHMFMNFGDVQCAEYIFNSIKKKDTITYYAMMKGYIENEMYEKILDLFEQMHLNLDNVIYTLVFNACAQLANDRAMKIGEKLLQEMPDNYRNDNVVSNSAIHMLIKFDEIESPKRAGKLIRNKDIITYGALMNTYNMNSEPWKCFKIFEEMKQQNIVLNGIIWNILIGACSQIGMIRRSHYIIDQIPSDIQNEKQIQNSLIHMWSKCGSIEKAQNIYKSVYNRNKVTYTAMINGFGLNGMGYEAIELYKQMPNHLRNEITHICVLNACSHSGLLHQAQNIFNEIPFKTEKIYTTMIDCLSRLFIFDEAQKLIDEYEKTNSPNLVMYICLLSGTRNNRNSNLSKKIYNRMKSLFPDAKQGLVSGAILLANIYSSVGEHQRAKDFRYSQIKELRTKVKLGLSWTDGSGEIVGFTAHDHSHLQSAEIYAELDRLTSELIEHGYVCDSSWVTRELYEQETIESVLCSHSERLALAFNFIQRPIPDFIQITKNLRICGDCHEFTKLVAKIRQVNIIVRDANRIHHFNKNGQCSCQDHF
ncbi:unnamed protein product [Rotaria sordida]|uniref:DYW domain-containing protein n=1 Tax=Rotaria sordida TaxID=392033 RepID=A0A814LMZ4_9BILA|nr:unnamed protein product [Rotaria sordida]